MSHLNRPTKAGTQSVEEFDAESKQHCDGHSCPDKACPRMEMQCSNQELPEHNDQKTGNPAPINSSSQLDESNGVDDTPEQKSVKSVIQSDGNCCTDKVGATTETSTQEGKELLEVDVGAECDIQLSEGDL